MPRTYTSNLGIVLPANGEEDGTWGGLVNTNSDILDRAINGVLSLSLSGTSSTLTTSDGILSNGQYKLLVLTGTPSGTHTITISPNDAQKIYYVRNTTAQSVIFTQGSGGNYTLLAGDSAIIYSNGVGAGSAVVNIADHLAMSSPNITGGTISGITDLAVADGGTGASTAADARTNLGLGTIATQAASAVAITGGSVSGITDLAVADGGTGASTAADARTNLGLGTIATQAASAVAITGGTISGITDLAVADGGTGASTAAGALTNFGITATAAELNILDGVVRTTSQINTASADMNAENRIINGDFGVWQRGTSFTIVQFGADRWINNLSGGTVTQSRQAFAVGDALGSTQPVFYLRQAVSGQTLASHLASTIQRIEGVRTYAGQTVTVLGWAQRSSGTGNMAVEAAQSFGTGGSPSAAVTAISPTTVTLTGSWAPFAIVLAVPSVSGKTLGTDNNDYLALNFWTSAGSDFNARTNSLGLQTIGVDLWGVHIRVGTWAATDAALYRPRDPGTETALCQRYYEVVSATAAINGSYVNGYSFAVTKRAIPTLTVVAGGLAGSTWQGDANRIVQINNSSGANGVAFGCDAEI
jgi:hypothetical protein